MGVVFFPSLPFMGVMLFPNIRLGNASGEGGASLALFSLFLFFFFLLFSFFPFFSSPAFSSASLFLLSFHSPLSLSFRLNSFASFFFPSSSSFSTHSVFLLCLLLPSPALLFSLSLLLFSPYHTSFRLNSFVPFFSFFFFFKGTACTVCFQGVGDDATCN